MTDASSPALYVFGGIAASGADGPVELGGPKQRAVLALLMLECGRVVTTDRMIDAIWRDDPPAKADASIRGYVSNLRRALMHIGADPSTAISFRDGGYVLTLSAQSIDLHQFEEGIRDGLVAMRLGDDQVAEAHLTHALGLWRGAPFGATADHVDLQQATSRMERLRGDAIEALTDVRLRRGQHREVAAELPDAISNDPYRERLHAQLALAQYRSGNPVHALRTLDETRRLLVDDLGVDPGPELTALQTSILEHDPALLWSARSPAPDAAAPPTETRAARAPSGHNAPLVGRQPEVDALTAALDQLRVFGQATVLSGEAGIGKTRLARTLVDEATRRDIAYGWGRCTESSASVPYRSWRSATRHLADRLAPSALRLLDPAAHHTGSDIEELATGRVPAQLGVVDAIRDLPEPVVIVIDDLQWADEATLSLVEFIAAELDQLPLLLVLTVRRAHATELSARVSDCLAELWRISNCTQLALTGLDEPAVANWISTMVGPGRRPELVSFATRTTDGNPFYLSELLGMLEAQGALDNQAFSGVEVGVPKAVHDVIRRRTSRLPPSTQVVVSIAAVIGRRFDVNLLAAILDRHPVDTVDTLGPAMSTGLVEPDAQRPGRYRFSHALVHETLVAEQNPGRLAAIHVRILDELERRCNGRPDLVLDQLAHHAWLGAAAGCADRAHRYSLDAADAALRQQSPGDAATHLTRALQLMQSSGAYPLPERLRLMIKLGRARRDSGDLTGGRAVLIDAAELAETISDDESVAHALDALSTDDLWAGIDWSLYDERTVALIERVLARSGSRPAVVVARLHSALAAELVYLDPDRADRLSLMAVESAERTKDPVVVARALLQRFWGVSGSEHLQARVELGRRFVELADSTNLPDRFRPLAHLAAVSAAYETADVDTLRRCHSNARRTAHPARTPIGWAHLLYLETSLALLAGDLERAERLADDLEQALTRVRTFSAATTRAGFLAVIHTEQGRFDEALAQFRILDATPFGSPANWLRAWILAESGDHQAAAGALAAFDGHQPDTWLRVTIRVAGVLAASKIGDRRLLRANLPELYPVIDRFACVGNGGFVLGPVAYAVAAGEAVLGNTTRARHACATAQDIAQRMDAALWQRRVSELRIDLDRELA